jgi:hypothetical protein
MTRIDTAGRPKKKLYRDRPTARCHQQGGGAGEIDRKWDAHFRLIEELAHQAPLSLHTGG